MHNLKTIVFLALSAFSTLAGITAAQAAAVTNLSDETQTVEIAAHPGYQKVEIAPNETWRMQAKVHLRFGQRELWVGENEEYVIWQDGSFGPQRPNTRGGRNF